MIGPGDSAVQGIKYPDAHSGMVPGADSDIPGAGTAQGDGDPGERAGGTAQARGGAEGLVGGGMGQSRARNELSSKQGRFLKGWGGTKNNLND